MNKSQGRSIEPEFLHGNSVKSNLQCVFIHTQMLGHCSSSLNFSFFSPLGLSATPKQANSVTACSMSTAGHHRNH